MSVLAKDPAGVTELKYLATRERNDSCFICDFMGCDENGTWPSTTKRERKLI